ncbi:MAG: DUF4292 domain-containing protein [Bacteroidales bacterium]|nr:DUF4292 domain-containing protein [Bacteroidales bacterium]
MNRRHYILLGLMLAALLATGCKTNRQLVRDNRVKDTVPATQPATNPTTNPATRPTTQPVTPTEPVATTPKYPFQTLSANLVVTAGDYNVNAQLRMLNDSIIWLTVSKFIELARVYITPDSVKAYIKPTNDYIRCSMEDFKKQYAVDIDFATLQDILLGEAVRTRVVTTTPSNHTTLNQLRYAKNIKAVVRHPRLSQTVLLKYSTIELDKPQAFPFSIPKSASPLK